MKKTSKIIAVAAAVAVCGAFALGGCGAETAEAMTEEDAASLNAAFVQAQTYDGSYTVNEEYSSYVSYLSTIQSSKGSATVTYDKTSGAMGYVVNLEDAEENYSMGYYTVPQSDGSIKQYVDFLGLKVCQTYAADEEVADYYTSYADCMGDIFSFDIDDGAAITTVEGFIAYWQEFLSESIDELGDYFGVELTFTEVEATIERGENGFTLTFSSEASLSEGGSFLGAEISAYAADYTLSVKVENNFISEISSTINHTLTAKYGMESVNMKGVATNKDTFVMEYDSSVIPSDFSDYIDFGSGADDADDGTDNAEGII